MRFLFLVFGLLASVVWSQSNVFGKVFDGESGLPLRQTQILTLSGKKISETDEKGAFAFAVPRLQMKVVFLAQGYVPDTLALDEVEDLFALEVFLKSSGEALGTSVTLGKAPRPERKVELLKPSPRQLELFSGMQLDAQDQIRMIPGVSGSQEFKSDLSLLGSLPGEVGTYIGALRVPWARHLDIGFPGNLSMFPSSLFSKIEPVYTVSERVGGGSGAGALLFTPASPVVESFGGRFALGTALREFSVETPFFVGDGLRVSYRMLQEGVLEKMAQSSFSEYSKRGNENSCDDPCDKGRFGNQYSLSAWDFYAQTGWRDSTGSADFFYFNSQDDFEILQDTAKSYASLDNQRVGIFIGDQNLQFFGGQWVSPEGWAFAGAYASHVKNNEQRDTARVWSADENSPYYRTEALLLGKDSREINSWQSSVDGPIWSQGGNAFAMGLRFEGEKELIEEKMAGTQKQMEVTSLQGSAIARYSSKKGSPWSATGGVRYEVETGSVAPLASFEWAGEDAKNHLYAELANSAEWVKETVRYQSREGRYSANTMGRLGYRLRNEGLLMDLHAYGRYYNEASLPRPDLLYTYAVEGVSEAASLGGFGLHLQWFSPHSWALQTQINSLYGTYDQAETLPLESSRNLDVVSNVRYYPRNDSLLSVILIHRASLGAPLYRYTMVQHSADREGYFAVDYDGSDVNTFRTDLRLHLNLNAAWPPLQSVRFYVELDNLFAPFDAEWLRFLGGDNPRQRGWTYVAQKEGQGLLVPYRAPGQSLFVQFGVEGNFGF